jgi:hypothetical protein
MAMAIAIYVDSELDDASVSDVVVERKELTYDSVARLNVGTDEERDEHLGRWW